MSLATKLILAAGAVYIFSVGVLIGLSMCSYTQACS